MESDVSESGEEETVGTDVKSAEEIKDVDRLKEAMHNVNAMSRNAGELIDEQDNLTLNALKNPGKGPDVDPEFVKTLKLLETDPKKALRALAETVTEAKGIHRNSKDGKFTSDLHAAMTSLLPKLAKEFKKLEAFVVNDCPKDQIPELATSLNKVYKEFNEAAEFANRTKKKPKK